MRSARIGIGFLVGTAVLGAGLPSAMAGDRSVEVAIRDDPAYRIRPEAIVLDGPDAVQQLIVEEADSLRDRTATARFEAVDPGIATVDDHGAVAAVSDGETSIRVACGAVSLEIPVTVRRVADPPPIHFANMVVPIFTKLGCNSGGCHGKAGGQNGFRLSLLGFEPKVDYATLVKEGRGRRLFPSNPRSSLLLQKATGQVPHGGGARLSEGSRAYRTIVRWIGDGMPVGADDAADVERIEVYPDVRTLPNGAEQQLTVTAVYSDGTTEDVTRWAQYESNVTAVAEVARGGRVRPAGMAGQAAVMVRYQGEVAVFRALVPSGASTSGTGEFPASNEIDTLASSQWDALGLVPSGLCDDAEFIRRAMLDLNGTLPTMAETRAFIEDRSAEKRSRLIDDLLERPEYATSFAMTWAEILRNHRGGDEKLARSTYRFHDWIRRQIAQNVPFDEFARSILEAKGSPETAPAVVWYRDLKTPDQFVDDAAQVFLGMRLQCAKCHHHPFEVWGQDDYYGFAAFFAKVGRKGSALASKRGRDELVISFDRGAGVVRSPKDNRVLPPRGLGMDHPAALDAGDDPREALVDWMTDQGSPLLASAVVNRYWAHFFGRGLVEPVDDLRATNPASNPDLMRALADDLIAHDYDLKHLIRTICTSRLYGLSSTPNESNTEEVGSFTRHYPKRMKAEVLLDAIAQVTGSMPDFEGFPGGTRAIALPDESVPSGFLDAFGRPQRETVCECERVADASLGQSLMLLNAPEIQAGLSSDEGRPARLASDPRPAADTIPELFWDAFGRAPTDIELEAAVTYVEARPGHAREAFEDILWALVNAKEFQFVD